MSQQTAVVKDEFHAPYEIPQVAAEQQTTPRHSLPASVRKEKILWPYFLGIVGFHLLALFALART